MKNLQAHEEAIRSQVCTDCIYDSGSGICGEGRSTDCPLNMLLPRAVEAVKSGKSATVLEYFRSLRTATDKSNGERDRIITLNEADWLKRSMALIVAAVEEADARMDRTQR